VAIFIPGPRETLGDVSAAMDRLNRDDIRQRSGKGFAYQPKADGTWAAQRLDFPDNATIGIADTNLHSEDVFLNVAGFLQPSSLWLARASDHGIAEVKTLPPKFDATHLVAEQMEATSRTGRRCRILSCTRRR